MPEERRFTQDHYRGREEGKEATRGRKKLRVETAYLIPLAIKGCFRASCAVILVRGSMSSQRLRNRRPRHCDGRGTARLSCATVAGRPARRAGPAGAVHFTEFTII